MATGRRAELIIAVAVITVGNRNSCNGRDRVSLFAHAGSALCARGTQKENYIGEILSTLVYRATCPLFISLPGPTHSASLFDIVYLCPPAPRRRWP